MCLKHKVTRQDIMSHRRQAPIVKARQEAMYLIKNNTAWSYPQIGRYFGKDHTTVLHAVQLMDRRIASNAGA
jgi:chromosomal replication initiator protein